MEQSLQALELQGCTVDGELRLPSRDHLGELSQMWKEQLCVRSKGSPRTRTPVFMECQRVWQNPGPESAPRTGTGKGGEGSGTLPFLCSSVPRTGRGQRADLPVPPSPHDHRRGGAGGVEKKTAEAFRREAEQEVDRLIERVLQDHQRLGHLDLEASEMAIRATMHQMGGVLLEKLLNSDGGGYRGAQIACGQGHPAAFVGYRSKQILTVLSAVNVLRAYYHCPSCQSGFLPKDQELDVVGVSLSPGVRRMMGRVGGKESFEHGREDMQELAGVVVKTKHVERISEELGTQIEALRKQERESVLSGKVVPLLPAVPKLYIAIDGTGVPMVPRETEGRRGKEESGKAKTREAKIGCVFTQTSLDEEGYPIRGRGIHDLCRCDRGSRGHSTRPWAGREGHCLGRRSALDLGNCGAALSLRHADCGSLSCPRAFGQSGQSHLWAHQHPGQTIGSGLLETTRRR